MSRWENKMVNIRKHLPNCCLIHIGSCLFKLHASPLSSFLMKAFTQSSLGRLFLKHFMRLLSAVPGSLDKGRLTFLASQLLHYVAFDQNAHLHLVQWKSPFRKQVPALPSWSKMLGGHNFLDAYLTSGPAVSIW